MRSAEFIAIVNRGLFSCISAVEESLGGALPGVAAQAIEPELCEYYSAITRVYSCDDGFVGVHGIMYTHGLAIPKSKFFTCYAVQMRPALVRSYRDIED